MFQLLCLLLLKGYSKKVAISPYKVGRPEYLNHDLDLNRKYKQNVPLWTMEFDGSFFRFRAGRRYMKPHGKYVKIADGGDDLEKIDRDERIRSIERMLKTRQGIDDDSSENNDRHQPRKSTSSTNRERPSSSTRSSRDSGDENPVVISSGNSELKGSSLKNNPPLKSDNLQSMITEAVEKILEKKLSIKNKGAVSKESNDKTKLSNLLEKLPVPDKSGSSGNKSSLIEQSSLVKSSNDKSNLLNPSSIVNEVKDSISKSQLTSMSESMRSSLGSQYYNENANNNSHNIGFDFNVFPVFISKIDKKSVIVYKGKCMDHNLRLEICDFEDWWDLENRFYWAIYSMGDIENIELMKKAVIDTERKNYRFHEKNRVDLNRCPKIEFDSSSYEDEERAVGSSREIYPLDSMAYSNGGATFQVPVQQQVIQQPMGTVTGFETQQIQPRKVLQGNTGTIFSGNFLEAIENAVNNR